MAGCRSSRGDSSIVSKTKPADVAAGGLLVWGRVVTRCRRGKLVVVAVVPPLQRWLIVVAGRVSIVAGRVRSRCASQTWLVGVLVIVHLAPIFKRGQTRFDVIKFGCRYRIFLPGRQDLLDLFLGLGNAVWGLRMRSKRLGQSSRLLLFHGLQLLEEGHERLWVVSRLIHILQAQVVSQGV